MKTLNVEQQAAINSTSARKIILAGPGSGKTETLVHCIMAAVARHGADAVAVVTYTTAGAIELKERLKLNGCTAALGYCGTLHSWMLQLIRANATALCLPETLAVIDEDQREGMVVSVMEKMGIKAPWKTIELLLSDTRFMKVTSGNTCRHKSEIVAIGYHQELIRNGLLDFQSILYHGELAVRLLVAANHWSFKALHVDEAQDSAIADFRIYNQVGGDQTIIGDVDQSVYGFRGAEPQLFIYLTNNPDWKVYTLETNHRCQSNIAEAAQRLIEKNTGRYPKVTRALITGGNISVEKYQDPTHEATGVMTLIASYITDLQVPPSDIAVLARTNRQAELVADIITQRGIPVARRTDIVDPLDWRKAKLLLTVLSNPYSDFAVYNYLKVELGHDQADAAKSKAAIGMIGLNESLGFRFGKGEAALSDVDLIRHGISPASRQRIHDACRELSAAGPWTLSELVLFLGRENVAEQDTDGVFCGTIHGAKGREWSHVFIIGCEEGIIPGKRDDTEEKVSEARRLMFVALTRAKETVRISWCNARAISRGPNLPPGPPEKRERSRFLSEAGL